MRLENKVAIIVVTYNCPKLLPIQIDLVKRYCTDEFDFIVVDNSTDDLSISKIKKISKDNNVIYFKTMAHYKMGSRSHSISANYSYSILKDKYDYFFYLDHDCFPVEDFSVIETLSDKSFAGVPQIKPLATYLWQGCLMFKRTEGIDFSPNIELGLDTGGNFYKLITEQNTIFFTEMYEENPNFNHEIYSRFSMIDYGTFMHFVNGSNWNNVDNNNNRIDSLLNILNEKVSGNILP